MGKSKKAENEQEKTAPIELPAIFTQVSVKICDVKYPALVTSYPEGEDLKGMIGVHAFHPNGCIAATVQLEDIEPWEV